MTLLGSAVPALAAAPMVIFYDPADNASDTVARIDFWMTFDQPVSAVANKYIVIRNAADGSVWDKIAVNDTTKVRFDGNSAIINPSSDLAFSTAYYVQVDAGAFVNSAGEAYAGIADTGTWNFTTRAAGTVTATDYTPAKGSSGVSQTADLSLSFSECVKAVTGKNIVIMKTSDSSVAETIAADDSAKVTISCSKQSGSVATTGKATINPASDLLFNTGYFVQIDAGAFVGTSAGAIYPGILDNSTWAFSTGDLTAPTVPAGLGATAVGSARVNLLWTASTDNVAVTAYKVYRNNFLVATLGNVTNYSDTGLAGSTTYSYAVAACDAAGNCSSASAPASATTVATTSPDTQAPTVPAGLATVATIPGAIYLSWTGSTDNVGVTRYDIYRGGTPLVVLGNVTSYTDTGLTASTAYSYSVAACDRAGNCSAQSQAVSGTTTPPRKAIAATTEVLAATNPNVSVGSDGSLVVAATPGQPPTTVVLKTDAAVNVDVKLPSNQPVIISTNGITQQITDVSGRSKFATVNKGGIAQIELVTGQMQVEADRTGTSVALTSSNSQSTGALITSADQTTVAVIKDETKATVFIDSGKVGYAAGSKPAATIYQGENGTVDPGGNLTQVALGSLNGSKQIPGDPLPVSISKDADTKIPKLDGTVPRLGSTASLLDLVGDAIKELAGDTSGQLSYDSATGVVTYSVGGKTFRMTALGDVQVQRDQFAASSISATAGGAYSLASRGIQMTLSGALGYFSDLQSQVKALDNNAQLSLKSSGAIDVRMLGGHYLVMPGLTASLPSNPTTLPGFESDASGYAVFRDRLGTLQTLYPTFLDSGSLSLTFATLDPSLSVTSNGNGTVTAVLAGQTFTLLPDYAIIDQPLGHASDAYWIDNGAFYFHNSDQSAQGFRLK